MLNIILSDLCISSVGVGLDIIGDYLTEINVTSPTCVQEIDMAQNTAIGDKLIAAITRRIT